jgi:hypothetical protein
LKKYSPAFVNVYVADWPGASEKLNSPSKNCVAQCLFALLPGFVNVTVVPSGTCMCVG